MKQWPYTNVYVVPYHILWKVVKDGEEEHSSGIETVSESVSSFLNCSESFSRWHWFEQEVPGWSTVCAFPLLSSSVWWRKWSPAEGAPSKQFAQLHSILRRDPVYTQR